MEVEIFRGCTYFIIHTFFKYTKIERNVWDINIFGKKKLLRNRNVSFSDMR